MMAKIGGSFTPRSLVGSSGYKQARVDSRRLAPKRTDRVVMNERTDHVSHDGKSITLATCGVFEIENGHIKAWRDYSDTSALNAA